MKKNIKIFIEGKLESADFNYYCQTTAFKYDINAVYKNGDTRHVFMEAEGEAEDLNKFAKEIKDGPLSRFTDLFRIEEGEFRNIEGFTSLREKQNKKSIRNIFDGFLS